jgi:hypothetical protein
MRVVGYVLVALALACGPMGVRMQSNQASSEALCDGSEIDLCEAASYVTAEPHTPPGGVAAREDVIPLNTRGYNYSRPGSYRPPIPSNVVSGSGAPEH